MTEIERRPTTILLFGDQTDSWVENIDQLYQQAASTPWLKLFLDQLADAINAEAKNIMLDRAIQDSLGHFSSLQDLGERYRHSTDDLGVARSLLLHTVRAGTLLQWVKREPHLLGPHACTEWLGISGGLLTLSALTIAEDFESLYEACLEIGRLVVRVCKLTSERSRAVEDRPGVWGWAVLGISPGDLGKALNEFQQSAGIPSTSRAQVGVTGAGWSTVIGPPSVLQFVINECPALRSLAKNPLEIKAIQHTLNISSTEIDYLVGNNLTLLDRPLRCPNHRLWGMDDPAAPYTNWGDQLRAVCLQVLSRPLDITQAVGKLDCKLKGVDAVRVIQVGSSSHASYVARVLEAAGRDVSVHDQQSLRNADDGGVSLKAGHIAIVGTAGRGFGSDNVDKLCDVTMSQQNLSQEVPKDRFDIDGSYRPQPNDKDNDASPAPTVTITLLQGHPGLSKTPFYLMADGTGSSATYMHLPAFKSKMPVYGIDSPFLRCPSRLTSQVGITGVAGLIVTALVKAQPKGPLFIGGFSAGCMVAFEVCRQLAAVGRKVAGLVLIDQCCPRSTLLDDSAIEEEAKAAVAVFEAAAAKDGQWSATASTIRHLSAYFVAMRLYNPPAMTAEERPAGTALIWAEKGMINHFIDDPKMMKMLADEGIPTKAYPGYFEDPTLSPMAGLLPDKTEADLGPNGWDKYVGDVLTLSVNADHLDLLMPSHVTLLHAQLEEAFIHFNTST